MHPDSLVQKRNPKTQTLAKPSKTFNSYDTYDALMENHHSMSTSTRRATLAAGLFTLIATYSTLHHEVWRDEAQAWMIAKGSNNPLELWQNLAQEGHPPLWHMILWVLSALHLPLESMQILNALIGAFGVFVFFRSSPFNLIEKTLFCFGYFFLYEWTVISRNYAGGLVFLFVSLTYLKNANSKDLKQSLAFYIPLALSGLFNIFNLIIAFALTIYLCIEAIKERRLPNLLSVSIFVALSLVSAWSIARGNLGPTPTSPINSTFFSKATIIKSQELFWSVHALTHAGWWGPFQLSSTLGKLETYLPPMLILAISANALRNKTALVFYAAALTCTLTVLVGIRSGGTRHSGYLLIVSIVVLWLILQNKPANTTISKYIAVFTRSSLLLILIYQFIAGIAAIKKETKSTFSSSKKTAEILNMHAAANRLGTFRIASIPDWVGTPVAAYAGKPYFNPYSEAEEYFVFWQNRIEVSDQVALNRVLTFAKQERTPTYIVTNRELSLSNQLIKLSEPQEAAVHDEKITLYLYKP